MLRFFTADLHIHTVLSACAEPEMLPEFILKRAGELRLDLLAVTDHNSAENAEAMLNAAEVKGIRLLPGMEVQTQEEVHLLCLFDALEQILAWQEIVYARLPRLKNRVDVFGAQVVLNAHGDPIRYNDRLLVTSTSLSVDEVTRTVHGMGGLCIPAHVDRPAYSIIANLGFIPPDLGFQGVEISHLTGPRDARQRFPQLEGYTLVANSDAHRLGDMGRRTTVKMIERSVAELALAFAGEGGRGVWVDGIRSVPSAFRKPRLA